MASWAIAPQQNAPCTIEGFYAVGPLSVGPPVAYVFGAEEARLIASAPDLYEALERVARWINTSVPIGTEAATTMLGVVRAALEKATPSRRLEAATTVQPIGDETENPNVG